VVVAVAEVLAVAVPIIITNIIMPAMAVKNKFYLQFFCFFIYSL
jgi:hypothetical protein